MLQARSATSRWTTADGLVEGPIPDVQDRAELDVIIVSYAGEVLLDECLRSLFNESANLDLRVVVVDNASPDGTSAMVASSHPWATLVENRANVGFACAANIGIRMTTSPFVLLLNPDTVVPEHSLGPCLQAIQARPEVGVLGCRLIKGDGTLDHACKRNFPTPATALMHMAGLHRWQRRVGVPGGYTASNVDEREAAPVDAVNGAFMLVRRSALAEVGLLDEAFWMYGEDLDWCRRFWNAGWAVLYWPGVTVLHVKGGVTGRYRRWRTNLAFHRAMWLFYRKHEAGSRPLALNGLVWTAIWAKLAISAAHSASKRASGRLRPER